MGAALPTRVNGEELDELAVAEEARVMLPQLVEAMRGEPRAALVARAKEWAREIVIERILLRQAAIADPEPVSDEDLNAAIERLGPSYRPSTCTTPDGRTMTEAEVQFRIARLEVRYTDKLQPPKSKEIGDYYKKNANQFCARESVHCAHIVRNIDEKTDEPTARAAIEEVARKLAEGADFAQLADESSDCPGRGGDLGLCERGSLVPEFEQVVFNLKPGQISAPFRSPFGYHIARLFEILPARVLTFPEVRDQIAKMLFDQKRRRAMERYLDQLRAKAVIEG